MFQRELRGGDAQGETADDGPGGEPGGKERAGERAGGGWEPGTAARASAEAMESSWSVARGKSPAQKVDQWQRSPLQAGIRLARQGRLLRLVSSYLPAQLYA